MSSLADQGINDFARNVRATYSNKPIVYLALDPRELEDAEQVLDFDVIDTTYLWTGDSSVLLGLIKGVEDRLNADHDTADGVRIILVLEDSPRYYSAFLGLLYEELMKQAKSLYLEGLNELQRKLYIRSRPKILHAASYEEGMKLYKRYAKSLLALICDVRLPRKGKLDPAAGFAFAKRIRRDVPDLPVLFQSAEEENAAKAAKLGLFVNKNSREVLSGVRAFLADHLGFGDFVFRLPDGTEIARAADVRELREQLETVTVECVEFHASHDHFSIWLMARSEFELAEKLRPKKISDFESVEDLRQHLLHHLREARHRGKRGIVTDFQAERLGQDEFSRIGEGSLGAKARGLAFLYQRLSGLEERPAATLPARVPRTVALTTEVFDEFADDELTAWAIACEDDREVARRFTSLPLPASLMTDLEQIVGAFSGPLAIRSSSLLEDSAHQPFAGIYATHMIPNSAPSLEQRREELATAIRLVFASTFYRDACAYRESTGAPTEREKMAVIVQSLVGARHGNRFYPTISGVALTRNFYPIGPQKAEQGVVHLALGLGRMIVDGGLSLRFSPKHPEVLPQIATPKMALKSTQREFFAVDLTADGSVDPMAAVRTYALKEAEEDGTLGLVGSVLSRGDERLVEDLSLPGPRVVSFHNILKHRALPLVETLRRLMGISRQGLGREVEIEFAVQMDEGGHSGVWCNPELIALQVRPMTARPTLASPPKANFARQDLLCASSDTLGHGVEHAIRDVIYVKPQTWGPSHNRQIANEGRLVQRDSERSGPALLARWPGALGQRRRLARNPRPVVPDLACPGRWWRHHRCTIRSSLRKARTSSRTSRPLRIAYFTLPPGSPHRGEADQFIDIDWLDDQPAEGETTYLRHVRFAQPLTTVLRGREGHGMIVKPGADSR